MELRTLKEGEIEQWFDHLGGVFTTPRDYFVKHWFNDPTSSYQDILVAYDNEKGQIASTMRIFRREFYLNGKVYSTGGIGEVSTKPEYRSQGLAAKLINMAVDIMVERSIPVSTLSASKARPYYEKMGWKVAPKFWSEQTIPHSYFESACPSAPIRPGNFSSVDEVTQFTQLHSVYAKKFNGIVVRSDPLYWANWLKAECGDGAFVLTEESDKNKVVGFVCVGFDGKIFTVKDFFVDERNYETNKGSIVLRSLVEVAVKNLSIKNALTKEAHPNIELKYPCVVVGAEQTKDDVDGTKLFSEYDVRVQKQESFLYRVVGQGETQLGDTDKFIKDMCEKESPSQCKHVFWDVDKF